MPKATKKSHHVHDTYANEGQEEFNNVQEALCDNELQEDYNNLNESQENIDVTHESNSDQEVVFNPKPNNKQKGASFQKQISANTNPTTSIYALY